jgi:hypothetical protein
MKRIPAIAMAVVALSLFSSNAGAALGGDIASIDQDRMQMKASVPVRVANEKFMVHEMTLTSGTIVREYMTTMGTVFAVTWRGQTIPDLRQLMGSYFDTFTSASNSQQSQRSHMIIRQDDLVVRSGGHMRAYMGSAYAPKLLPAGVTEADIK